MAQGRRERERLTANGHAPISEIMFAGLELIWTSSLKVFVFTEEQACVTSFIAQDCF
jgi:hypothetical protein